jgi:hypothetical protein
LLSRTFSRQDRGPRKIKRDVIDLDEIQGALAMVTRKHSASAVLLLAGVLLVFYRFKEPSFSELPRTETVHSEESWTENANKISQEELDRLADYVTRLRQQQAKLKEQCQAKKSPTVCNEALEEALGSLEPAQASGIRGARDHLLRLKMTQDTIRQNLSQAEDTARKYYETIMLALFEEAKQKQESEANWK